MHDVMRKRIMRKLEVLPESQLYQVLDYIEFLEGRHAHAPAPSATGFQRFAERLEDQMRIRSLAVHTMNGTMKVVSVAGKVIDGISSVFEAPGGGAERPRPPAPRAADAEPLTSSRVPLSLPRSHGNASDGPAPGGSGERAAGRPGDESAGPAGGGPRKPESGPEPA